MIKSITDKQWENFFAVVGKLSVAPENEGMSEDEVWQAVWAKAESEGYREELEQMVCGLRENMGGEEVEE